MKKLFFTILILFAATPWALGGTQLIPAPGSGSCTGDFCGVTAGTGVVTAAGNTLDGTGGLASSSVVSAKAPLANPTFTGKVTTAASAAVAGAGFNLPHGVAPNSPANGDCWTTTAGMYCYINSGTVGPFTVAGAFAPTYGTLTNGKWCTTNGTTVACTQDTPAPAVNGVWKLTDTGSANALAVAPSHTLADGDVFIIKVAAANTGATTLATDGGSALAVYKYADVALGPGDLPIEAILQYRSSGTKWKLLNPVYQPGTSGCTPGSGDCKAGATKNTVTPVCATGTGNGYITWDTSGVAYFCNDTSATPAQIALYSNVTGIIASSISDSDTTHCPDGNSVYDALAGKGATNADTTGMAGKVGVTTSSLTAGKVYYRSSTSAWTLADNSTPIRGHCYAASTTQCITQGVVTATSHGFSAGDVYLSTAGTLTGTLPSTAAYIIQKIGWVFDANTLYINVSPDFGTIATP